MNKKLVVLVVLVILLAAAVGVLLTMDSRYKILFRSPRVSHETLVTPEKTRAVAVLNVPMAKSLIEQKLQAPGWALPMALPYEAALVVDLDRQLGDVALKVFVNEKRLAPMICEFSQRIKLPPPYDTWFHEPMRQERPGVLLREGLTLCSRQIRDTIDTKWSDTAVADALHIEGGHLLEAVLDNRDGSALAVASVVCDSQGINLDNSLDEQTLGFVQAISSCRVQADLVSDSELAVRLKIECDPSADPSIPAMLQMLVEMGMASQEVKTAARNFGCTYTGSTSLDGNTVVADYKVNAESLLARL